MGAIDEGLARIERKRPYVIHYSITVIMEEMTLSLDVVVRSSSINSLSPELVDAYKLSTTKIFLVLLCEIVAEYGRIIPDTEVQLVFVKSGYLVGEYIPMIRDVGSKKRILQRASLVEKRVRIVSATSWFQSSGDKRNSHVIVSGGSLSVANVLLLFKIIFIEREH